MCLWCTDLSVALGALTLLTFVFIWMRREQDDWPRARSLCSNTAFVRLMRLTRFLRVGGDGGEQLQGTWDGSSVWTVKQQLTCQIWMLIYTVIYASIVFELYRDTCSDDPVMCYFQQCNKHLKSHVFSCDVIYSLMCDVDMYSVNLFISCDIE